MIIIEGPPGAGKSVQGQMLVDSLGYRWLSVGALLRETKLDDQIKAKMDKGELLDNKMVEDLVAKAILALEDPKKVILDGFPRDVPEARWLIPFCRENKIQIEAVFNLVVDLEVAKKRLLSRGREDDHEEVVNRRLKEYENITLPVLDFLDEQGVEIIRIDGERSMDEVHGDIAEAAKSVHQD